MQTTGSGTSDKSSPTGVPPQERDEDSGLHDIRSMASSTKMRLSSRRISTSPPVDDDILASSSAGWKAVALPEPARMVSLPDITPSSVDEPKSKRDSKKELKAERASAKKIAKEAIAVETAPVVVQAPAPAPTPVAAAPSVSSAKPDISAPIIGSGRFAQKPQKSRTGLYAVIGLGLAAAAGAAFYITTMNKKTTEAANGTVASSDTSATENAAVAPQAPAATPVVAAAGSAAAEPTKELAIATDTPVADPNMDADKTGDQGKAEGASKQKAAAKGNKRGGKEKEVEAPTEPKTADPKPTDKTDKTDKKDGTNAKKNPDDPDFEALLKEAGVQDKKPTHVALEKKSLSSADIKKGMGGVAAKAQACYAGTQGTAQVKLTVSPDGSIKSVAVTGVFAGTPVGTCVENAVKGASFPAWEGGPQSFGYSYLLAE